MKVSSLISVLVFITFTACSRFDPHKPIKEHFRKTSTFCETDCFLVILVNARQLNYYGGNQAFFRSLVKHPSDASKNSDVGHAWLYLKGNLDENTVIIEGGHSGERGAYQPKYFDGVMNYCEFGSVCPTYEQKLNPCYEPNPIKYLWATLDDGFFQTGSGGHKPTFAIKVDLNPDQFQAIYKFIQSYNFTEYALTGRQCCSFVAQAAKLAGLNLPCRIEVPIQSTLVLAGETLCLWKNPCYSILSLEAPEALECSMVESVLTGQAQYALDWYLKKCHKKNKPNLEELKLIPQRLSRWILFNF